MKSTPSMMKVPPIGFPSALYRQLESERLAEMQGVSLIARPLCFHRRP